MTQNQPEISYLPVPEGGDVPEGVQRLWEKSQEAFGFVPNVFRAQAVNGDQFLAWWKYFNLLVNKEGYLTNAERELMAVVVAVKGLGRFAEIKSSAAAGERFIIGTFVSIAIASFLGSSLASIA